MKYNYGIIVVIIFKVTLFLLKRQMAIRYSDKDILVKSESMENQCLHKKRYRD